MKFLLLLLGLPLSFNLHAELFFTPQMINSHLENYSKEETRLLNKDLDVVRSVCLDNKEQQSTRFYLATAGAPGARKTTILERFVSTHPKYQGGVYLDPDIRALKFMVHTYHAQSLNPLTISSVNDYEQVIENAYNKWRGGSNYIALTLLEESFTDGKSVIHGTTSTGSHLPKFFTKLKENGYEITLLLCSCPDKVRYDAINYRNQNVRLYQSSPEDAIKKGKLFPQRLSSYFAYADSLYFYWSDRLFKNERLAGIWRNNTLTIYDRNAMNSFIDKYEQDRLNLKAQGISIPSFKSYLSTSDLKTLSHS